MEGPFRGNDDGGRRSRGVASAASPGFTLLELMVVIFLIGAIAAITLPQLAPVIAFTELEGQARRLAGYGLSVNSQALFTRDTLVVRFDLDNQEYYTVHWVVPPEEGEEGLEGEEQIDQLARLADLRRGGLDAQDLSKLLQGDSVEGIRDLGALDEEFDPEQADQQMAREFDGFARRALQRRFENVKHDESMFDEVDIFDDEEFDLDEVEPVEELVDAPTLEPVRIEQAYIEAMYVDGERFTRGEVEVEITPLGFLSETVFEMTNGDGDYFTIVWDPVMGDATVEEGLGEDY